MGDNGYDIWAMRINEAIRAKVHGGESTPQPQPLRELLLEFGEEASAIAGAIGRNIEGVEIMGADRQGLLEGFLEDMMRFEDFSYLEYRYKLESEKQPGIRFRVKMEKEGARIAVHYFEDLVFWKVDEEGHRIYHEPIQFEVKGGTIAAIPHPDAAYIYSGCSSWRMALRETLTLPFRYLYTTPYPRHQEEAHQ
jgi:hypothetical protein